MHNCVGSDVPRPTGGLALLSSQRPPASLLGPAPCRVPVPRPLPGWAHPSHSGTQQKEALRPLPSTTLLNFTFVIDEAEEILISVHLLLVSASTLALAKIKKTPALSFSVKPVKRGIASRNVSLQGRASSRTPAPALTHSCRERCARVFKF